MSGALHTPEKQKSPVVEQQPARAKPRAWWQHAAESATLLVLGVVVLEVFFNICGVGMEEILQPDTTFGTKHIPNKPVVWRMEGFSNDRFNSVGMRDVEHSVLKAPNTFRIALIGDSATEGLQVPLEDTYGRVLEKIYARPGMKTEVINFACSGYSTGQEVLQFEQDIARYKPDVTLLLYNRGDNVENIRKPTDLRGEPRPYFYIGTDGQLKQDDAVLTANAKALEPNATSDYLRRYSRIFGVFNHANLNLSINEALFRKLRGWVTVPFAGNKKTHSEALYAPQDGWKVTQALLHRLNSACTATSSELVVVAFPNYVQDPEFGKQIKDLKALSKQEKFKFHDLTTSFRWNTDPKSLFLKYHFSSKGHLFVAERIAEFLQKPQ